ncbi:hypothetical protein [Chitinophaga sp. Cy-1792]|uniref:hypothetical protein n=1 Tax=Chitinophaga sp. Cy-1792 TaxID=2608339 RepID=UPI0019659C65|nr:hypothetical protein [Chitinophaga sp. Cy-1792]
MKRITLLSVIMLCCIAVWAQKAESYFNKVRNNNVLLTAFINGMPKGGDLHHHYSGAVYAETYINYVIDKDYYINIKTLDVAENKANTDDWYQFSALKSKGQLEDYKEKLFQKWSAKDYDNSTASDKLFFDSFAAFGIAVTPTYEEGMKEMKFRAIRENVSYIECMFGSIPCPVVIPEANDLNKRFISLQQQKDDSSSWHLIDSLFPVLMSKDITACGKKFYDEILLANHQKWNIDDDQFTMRYQTAANRNQQPVEFFKNLIVAFATAADPECKLVTGVNILSPENGEVSMRDYHLQMLMFKYCHNRFPAVKYAMHAGELTIGLVRPEDLTWHINEAVFTAGAKRIGHGVDIAYENKPYELLHYMSIHKIPVEINLTSNEFILHVKDDRHPITLYLNHQVPVVISSDDPGILRTSLTEQYVLLASRYKSISYKDIKTMVYNSINYSFIKDQSTKDKLKAALDNRFQVFESQFH